MTYFNLPLTVAMIALLLVGCGSTPEAPVDPTPTKPQSAADIRVQQWRSLIATEQTAPEAQKLDAVNAFFNRLEFVDDIDHWGEEDFWATPLETIRSNGGDCEDFVIGKYFTLLELDVADERLRLTYVLSEPGNRPHMVLSYYRTPSAEPLLLDNLITGIRAASQRSDLKPIYSFNSNRLWVAGSRSVSFDEPAARMSRWRDVMRRMNDQKLN